MAWGVWDPACLYLTRTCATDMDEGAAIADGISIRSTRSQYSDPALSNRFDSKDGIGLSIVNDSLTALTPSLDCHHEDLIDAD